MLKIRVSPELSMNSSSPAGRIALSTVVVDAPDVVDYATEVFVQRAEALLRERVVKVVGVAE